MDFYPLQNELTTFGLWTTSIVWRKRLTISIILVENTSVHKLERASAMCKTRNAWTGNRMRGIGGMLYSGECRQTFRRISLNNPGNVAKYSRECCRKFQGIPPLFGVTKENYWAESHLESSHMSIANRLNLFKPSFTFLYPLKTSENL